MNAICWSNTETDVAICKLPVKLEDRYATAPLKSVLPKQPMIDDDVLHASFDAALSERLIALNKRWDSLSSSQPTPAYTTDPLFGTQSSIEAELQTFCTAQSVHVWSQRIINSCRALMLLLIGFDLMGLLVLNAH